MTTRTAARRLVGGLLVSAFFAWLLLRSAVLEIVASDTVAAGLHGLGWAGFFAGVALIAKDSRRITEPIRHLNRT